jgi:uncharacterized protein YidB (DUF937 family)
MGLLDDILGQLGGAQPQRRPQPPPASAAGGVDMSRILMALLPVVLSMLAQRGQRGGTGAGGGLGLPGGLGGSAGGGGGLGDVLGGILTGGRPSAGGPGMGGLGGLLEQLGRAGLGRQAQSWVSTGTNEAISAADVESLFGAGGLGEIARAAGLTEQETALGLSQLLPEVVDRVTPAGEVPEENVLLGSVEAMMRRMNAGGGGATP